MVSCSPTGVWVLVHQYVVLMAARGFGPLTGYMVQRAVVIGLCLILLHNFILDSILRPCSHLYD